MINKIQRFKQFEIVNEKVDLLNMNLDGLIHTIEGFELFKKFVTDAGGTARKITTHGWEFEFIGDEFRKILDMWKDKFDIEYTIDRVTNNNHPEYGKVFYHFTLFGGDLKPHDASDWILKMNK
jgi:hypothetical protein